LGFGININQKVFKSEAPNPVSLCNITDRNLELSSCLDKICQFLENRHSQLATHHFDLLDKDYYQSLFRMGQYHEFQYNKEIILAKITGVNNFGRLQLTIINGKQIECDFKEIKYIL
jgi:BirA family biotin operon repressor/biotin-[acetyl-CoA-carboxylase] ligase